MVKLFKNKSNFILLFLAFLCFGNVFAQSRLIRGHVTIGELNQPGIGGIVISVKGTSIATTSDNDGEYRISITDDNSVLVYSFPGMISQEITVGKKSRINVDLEKTPPVKEQSIHANRVCIIIDKNAGDIEKNVSNVLKQRLQKNSRVVVTIAQTPDLSANLNIYLGLAKTSDQLEKLLKSHDVILPGRSQPFAEGFAAKMVNTNNSPVIIALGADNRGLLYAAGEILRHIKTKSHAIHFSSFDVSTAPAYRIRGANATQGHTMQKYTGSRSWTFEEWKQVTLDHALAGANCFYANWSGGEQYDFLKSLDLLTIIGIRPNLMNKEIPEEWKAGGLADWEWIKSTWICPSIPEARQALLTHWEQQIEKMSPHDILRFYAGDPGGCRDERCMPWGKTFVHLCEDISKMVLKKHPDINIQIANQDLSNEGDLAIFDYLNEEPRPWLYGMTYGPGSNAMSWYFRHTLKDDLFEYPGYGWLNRYMAETLNSIPKHQKIVNFSDITHWIMSQYNVENPERNIAKSFGRRTWHTRPKALYNIFQAIMPFSQGDIIYTEGYHDHFNQYLWQRLLWNPHMETKDVVTEYCRINFGEQAAGSMTEAIFQLEKNLETPLATNDGIDRYYQPV